MGAPQAATRGYGLIQYLQVSTLPSRPNPNPFSFALPEESTLRDALDSHVELLRLRLGVQGAFVVLIGERCPYFLAGTRSSETRQDGKCRPESMSWLGTDDADLQRWLLILKQAIAVDTSSNALSELISTISSLGEDERSAKLSSVCSDPHLAFYAAAPITSKSGVPIGAVCIVDGAARKTFTAEDGELLAITAQKCMHHLESAREAAHQERWERMNAQLSRFVGSRSIRDQQLEEPPSLALTYQQKRRKEEIEGVKDIARRHGQNPSKAEGAEFQEEALNKGPESERVLHAEAERAKRVAREDEKLNARSLTAHADGDRRRGSDYPGESAYSKIFRRAAECLQEALQVDGVLFTNGLIGHHGVIQSVGQLEEDLLHEMVERPRREESVVDIPGSLKDASNADTPRARQEDDTDENSTTTRTYTSPEYWRGIYVEKPAEIIGISARDPTVAPKTKRIKENTVGLAALSEGDLQVLMDRYFSGSVWYFHDPGGVSYQIRNGTLVEDSSEETQRLVRSLPVVRQILFQPLRDPVTLKRLAGCFAWSTRKFPVLTDTMHVPALRGFLHVVESEISRLDAAMAVKQKEAFVSSVSHELRTPVHGILGSVQLLADTQLDPFQTALVDTIKTSGTALNETLASVLSYAKINQFERQQNKYRNRRPPDADWSLPNKVNLDLGPDTDYEGLYICTNIAMLCEEVAGVLEASESYDKSTDERRVTVVLDIDHEEHWNFYTEPGALRRILINIIGNALKYTDEGSVTITLAASKIDTSHGDHGPRRLITLSVKDTGKGMSRDFMDNHLFVPFTQEDTVSSRGVGLGMSIVKSLVSLLAGEIRVESQLGQGTEVTVTMPMRLFDSDHSDRSETEKPALDLKLCTDALRREHLSAVLFGFPNLVRRSLEKYLVEWFDCKILEAVEDAEPDVVLVDEGNEEVAKDLEKKAQRYGRLGVLLSIAMGLDTFSKSMRHIQGYTKWERVPRPLGPLNLGKALSACVEKLRYRSNEQQEEPNRTRQKHGTQVQEVHHAQDKEGNVGRGSLKPGRGSPNPSNEGLSTEVHTTSSNNLGIHLPRPENIVQESASSNRPLPTRSGSFNTDGCYNDSADPSTLRILVVEDNIINKKILGAFLKKYGCRDVTNAENGAVAVAAVEGCSQSFDVIFMDLSMPVMDGFQATREIRRIESERVSSNSSPEPTNRSYIIALTGLASDRDHDDALAAGVDKFVTKPVQFDKITKVLKQREGAAYDATHAEGP